jgi:hypothetical protein
LLVDGGTVNVSGTLATSGVLEMSGGTLSTSGDVQAASYTQRGGTLSGAGTLTVSGALLWTGGTMTGAGKTIAAGTLTLDAISAFSQLALDGGRVLENRGKAVWVDGYINLNASSTPGAGKLVNAAGASFEIQGVNNLSLLLNNFGPSDNGSDALFDNQGTLTKTLDNTISINAPLNNSGTLDIQRGTLQFSANPLKNNGVISIHDTSVLSVSGAFENPPSARVEFGVSDATHFGKLQVSGLATLAGTIRINHVNGFQPSLGLVLPVLTFATRTGTFTTIDPELLGNGLKYAIDYGNASRIEVKVVTA